MNLIERDLNNFWQGLQKAQKLLDTFSDSFSGKIENIEKDLASMSQLTQALRTDGNSPSGRLLNSEIDKWQSVITSCQRAAEENICGREFQNRFEKKPMVMVFGIVKAGKSTLGNFLHGRSFRKAAFPNVYKSEEIPHLPITVAEKGRTDCDTKEEFDENSTESTCSIQYFEIPGMAWVDTPGIGAIEKKDIDIRKLEDLAKQYVQYADLVVFLANSANPGINEDVDAYKTLYQNGKKALAIITRSDTVGYGKDANGRLLKDKNGKIQKVLVAKDTQRRAAQENALREALNKNGIPASDTRTVSLVSISTMLADQAIERQDEELWRGSNMGEVYRKITDVIANPGILELKKKAPSALLNSAIDKIIGTSGQEKSLKALLAGLNDAAGKMEKQYQALNPEGKLVGKITMDVVNQVRTPLRSHIDSLIEKSSKNQDVTISLEELQASIQNILKKALESHVRHLIGDFQEQVLDTFSVNGLKATAKHETEIQTYEVRVPYSVERSPDGVIEHVKSFFGKKYYRTASRTEMRQISIDLGIDPTEAKKDLLSQIEEAVRQYVHQELDTLREAFFGESRKKTTQLTQAVTKLVENLKQQRYQ